MSFQPDTYFRKAVVVKLEMYPCVNSISSHSSVQCIHYVYVALRTHPSVTPAHPCHQSYTPLHVCKAEVERRFCTHHMCSISTLAPNRRAMQFPRKDKTSSKFIHSLMLTLFRQKTRPIWPSERFMRVPPSVLGLTLRSGD
jgi:hypothetical protein